MNIKKHKDNSVKPIKEQIINDEELDIEYEELAMPEIHVCKGEKKKPADMDSVKKSNKEIDYEELAFPEIHLRDLK